MNAFKVKLQILVLREPLPAEVALERLRLVVGVVVVHLRPPLGLERLVANRANVFFQFEVYKVDVILKQAVIAKSFFTRRTHEALSAVNDFYVFL